MGNSRHSSVEKDDSEQQHKPSRRRSTAEREAHDERKAARRRSSAEREAAKDKTSSSPKAKGLAGKPLQMKPTESFARNFKYQDPDAWRQKREEDEIDNFKDYKKEKGRRQL